VSLVLAVGGSRSIGIGDDAFESLFTAEYPRVRSIAARTGLDAHESEDVAQEVFVQFHRRHRADAPYAAAWVRTAAVHLALNAIRTRRRRTNREERGAFASVSAFDSATVSSNPHTSVEDAERRREVRAVMQRLPERHATVLALRYSGMSYAEIATSIGVPASHVGSILRRAELAFKKEFDHESPR
jgi:RNA polymerase sigma-70 factor (ECF subfamily)